MYRGKFGSYDEEFVTNLVQADVKINTVYDIGASNGSWSWTINKILSGAHFELFESFDSDQYRERLRSILDSMPNAKMNRVAFGDENKTVLLNVYDSHFGNSLIESNWEGIREKHPLTVRRMDDYVQEQALPQPDLIKMDVQGFELKILKGGEHTCTAAKALMLETWLYRGYGSDTPLLGEIIEWLDARGFALVGLGDAYIAPDMKVTDIDAFFLRNDIAQQVASKGVKLMSS